MFLVKQTFKLRVLKQHVLVIKRHDVFDRPPVVVLPFLPGPEPLAWTLAADQRDAKSLGMDVFVQTFVQGAAYNPAESRPQLMVDWSETLDLSDVVPLLIVLMQHVEAYHQQMIALFELFIMQLWSIKLVLNPVYHLVRPLFWELRFQAAGDTLSAKVPPEKTLLWGSGRLPGIATYSSIV